MKKNLLHVMEDDDRALATICDKRADKMAARIRRELVLPYCKKHHLTFESERNEKGSGGRWWFLDCDDIHEVDEHITKVLDFHYGHDAYPIACSIDCVTEEDLT